MWVLLCNHSQWQVPTTWSLGKPIDSSGKCMGNLYSENALHVESAKQLLITIFIPVVGHALSDIRCFCLIFPFCLFTILFIYGQTDFLHFAVNEIASMATILVQEWYLKKKKKNLWKQRIPVCVKSPHVHFLAYTYIIYIQCMCIIIFHRRGRSVRLIRLVQTSLGG